MIVSLADAKAYLDVIQDDDDAKLQQLLAASIDEAMQFLDRREDDLVSEGEGWDSSSETGVPDSVRLGILILLQANYQALPADAAQLRTIAQIKLMPYRKGLGV